MHQTFDSSVLDQMTYAAWDYVTIYKKCQITYINLHITTTSNTHENIYFN